MKSYKVLYYELVFVDDSKKNKKIILNDRKTVIKLAPKISRIFNECHVFRYVESDNETQLDMDFMEYYDNTGYGIKLKF